MAKFVGLVFAAMLAVTSSASAATLWETSGKVLVNKGKGFVLGRPGDLLTVGDRVMVGEKSTAVIAYNACAVSLKTQTVVVVAEDSVCSDTTVIQPVADIDPVAATSAFPLPLIFIGGAAAVGGAIYVISTLDESNDPVSAN
jgi:hypothetical protein